MVTANLIMTHNKMTQSELCVHFYKLVCIVYMCRCGVVFRTIAPFEVWLKFHHCLLRRVLSVTH